MIPGALVDAFKTFVSLTPQARNTLRSEMVSAPLIRSLADLTLVISHAGLQPDQASQVARLLVGVAQLQSQLDQTPEEFVSSVDEGFKHLRPTSRITTEDQQRWNASKDDLAHLVAARSLWLFAKATLLAYDRTRVLESARIITEVRPAFLPNDAEFPLAVVTQVLRLHYFEDGEHKSISIALDSDDIQGLRSACDRASAKSEVIKKKLAVADVGIIVAGSDTDD
jgi:hypothetical protein